MNHISINHINHMSKLSNQWTIMNS